MYFFAKGRWRITGRAKKTLKLRSGSKRQLLKWRPLLVGLRYLMRISEQMVKLGVWWLRFFFPFLGGWVYLSKFSGGQFSFGREQGKICLNSSAKTLVANFYGDISYHYN